MTKYRDPIANAYVEQLNEGRKEPIQKEYFDHAANSYGFASHKDIDNELMIPLVNATAEKIATNDKLFDEFAGQHMGIPAKDKVQSTNSKQLLHHVQFVAAKAAEHGPKTQRKIKDYLSKILVHAADKHSETFAKLLHDKINSTTGYDTPNNIRSVRISQADIDKFHVGGSRHNELDQ